MQNKKISVLFLLILSVGLFFAFGFQHLTKFVTADEHYWTYERIPQYWQALSDFNLKKTLINDKPGITVAMFSGVGLLVEKDPTSHTTKVDADLRTFDVSRTENINLAFRLPILIINSLLLLYFFWIIKRVTENEWIALWSVVLMALSPILIGISQIINPDALFWSFSAAAIFSYLAVLKHNQKKFVFLTALFVGLTMLSKYTANILLPFFFFNIFFYYLFICEKYTQAEIKKYFVSQIFNLAIIVAGALAVIAIFLPAIIIKPIYLYRLTLGFGAMQSIVWTITIVSIIFLLDQFIFRSTLSLWLKKYSQTFITISKIVLALVFSIFVILLVGRNVVQHWQLFEMVPFDVKELKYIDDYGYSITLWEKFLFEFNPLVFSITPIALLAVLFVWLKTFFTKKSSEAFLVISATSFILIYYTASVIIGITSIVRYSIILYPMIAFLGGIGLWQISQKIKIKNVLNLNIAITLILIIFSSAIVFSIKPFYFNYTGSLLPKKDLISDAWGYGGYEAAQYLNALPNAKNITIWADYYGVCEFFVGRCITDYNLETGQYSLDYLALTRRGQIRYLQNNAKWLEKETGIKVAEDYNDPNPVWKIEIGNRPDNFIKIMKKY
ncbi:MAG: Glycosyl transferase, family 39 [Candidatus Moranbacteria bacterium GW2011_GWA2_39_41]|nr:MAG: Glycosyl transferase, family 39 [Candidatus Moranbacteria bacterium GW2011_GWA2_39_41]